MESAESPIDEPMHKTAHHGIADLLKEIACNPFPNDADPALLKFFDGMQSDECTSKEFAAMVKEAEKAYGSKKEQIADIVEKIKAYRGHNEKKIVKLLEKIQNEHGYKKPQMTKILEKINESDHYAVLHYGALFNNIPFCRCLIEDYGCNVNLVGWDGETPLHIAARLADINKPEQDAKYSILLYLLGTPKIKIDIQDSQGRTPLHHAIMYGCVENAKCLIQQGNLAQIRAQDIQGAIPLHYACRFPQAEKMVELFVSHTDLFKCETRDKRTPLHVAAEYGNLEIVKHLLTIKDSKRDGRTGLGGLVNAAIRHHDPKVLSFLAGMNMLNNNRTTLHFACQQLHGHNKIDSLINPESIMHQDHQDGFSPLMVAVKHRQLGCVHELLKHKDFTTEAFQLTSPSSLRSVLHICAEVNQDKITDELFKFSNSHIARSFLKGADVMGDTALHICAQVGNAYMSDKLLDIRKSTAPVESIPRATPRTMTNLDLDFRVPSKSSITTADRPESMDNHLHAMLTKRNKSKLTSLHVAIHHGKLNVIERLLDVAKTLIKEIIDERDEQHRTSLHMAAEKGHVKIVDLLLKNGADVDARDINDCTPLHEAARCSEHEEDSIERAQCIESLVKTGVADVNALNIRQETPLHIASEYGSSTVIARLITLDADLSATNVKGFNCLEVAIEQNNEDVVKFLIDHKEAFELMRNAQVREKKRTWLTQFVTHYEADTPMRKLICKMPKMALRMLDKCLMNVGNAGEDVHKQIFVYEFLDDQCTIEDWEEGNFGVTRKTHAKTDGFDTSNKVGLVQKKIHTNTSGLYTSNEIDIVMNHPIFLMAANEATELMSHPLSSRLAYQKFQNFGIYLFSIFILFYATFLALFTTVVLRTSHPQAYFNGTNFSQFDDSLCSNVSQELMKGSSSVGGKKTSADYVLKYFLYVITWIHVVKNICIIFEISRVSVMKTFTFMMEIAAVVLSFIFIYDQDFQRDLTFRCPIQWQYGAFGILISWVGLLHYVQFLPIIGLYVAMLSVILKKFMNFLLVLIILISGFALTFYMLFQNFKPFANAGLSYIKTALMISGEFGFDDRMYSDDREAYYKLAYLIYILFAVIMTILVTNLLIGLAVGEIPPLMKQAHDHQNQLFFQLVAECEIFRHQLDWVCRRHKVNDTIPYIYRDLNNKEWHQKLKRWILKSLMQRDDDDDESDSTTEKQVEQQTIMLRELTKEVHVLVEHSKA